MQIRYLVSIHEVNCAVPLRDHLSNLIATTAYIPDRNIYAANVTLAQWNQIREEYWATGRQCDHGRLVPSIDFIASDGKSFLDFEACRKHEEAIAQESQTPNLDRFNGECMLAIKATLQSYAGMPATAELLQECVDRICESVRCGAVNKPFHLPDLAERSEFIAAKICADVVQYNNGEFCNAATEHRFQEWLVSKSQAGNKARLDTVAKVEAEESRVAAQIEHLKQFEIKTTPDGPPVTLTTDSAPTSLEDRMLVVVGSNYMNIGLVASLLKTDENAVRAVAESSGKFKLSGTGKSIAKN